MTRLSLMLSLVLLGGLLTIPARAQLLGGTFLQLLDDHRDWDEGRWSSLLDELVALGIDEIVVQWTVFDDRSFFSESSDEDSAVSRLLSAADEKGVRVVLGLVHDPSWWEWIEEDREPRLVEVSLRRLEERHLRAATALGAVLGRHESFSGWYLPEEVDDRSWLADERREVLALHMKRVREALEGIAPGHPVAVSGFSNGFADPRTLAGLWTEILDMSGIHRLLFQDGVGAGKLDPREVPVVLGPLAADLAERPARFQVVVEVFRQTAGEPHDDGPFQAETAPLERILRQVEVGRTLSEGGILVFSAPEYLTSEGGPGAAKAGRRLAGPG